MGGEKLISIDLRADFAFFKKPDHNDGLLLSYNILHKPALLGILGAVIGLRGYERKGELPEYYQKLQDLPIGIEPLGHDKGNFRKTSVKYTNTVGYANEDGNLLVEESMLIRPAYRCYMLLSDDVAEHVQLYTNLKSGYAEFIPYLGKNEFHASWLDKNGENTFEEYEFTQFEFDADFQIRSLFLKDSPVRDTKVVLKPSFRTRHEVQRLGSFTYFEHAPVNFNEHLMQYNLGNFAFTDWLLKTETAIESLFKIKRRDQSCSIIQLF